MGEQTKAQAHLTITDLTDITDVYLEYCMAASTYTSAAAIQAKTTWTPPEVDWSTTYPTWTSGYQIWIREVKVKEGVAQPVYGTPYLDKAINQTNENLIEYISTQGLNLENLNTKTRFMWRNLDPHINGTDGWTNPNYPVGTYAASGIQQGNSFVIDYENSNTYGFNTYLNHNSLNLRYNAVKFTELNTSSLIFYYPKKDNALTDSVKYIQGESAIKLDVDGGLKFFNKGSDTEANRLAAELNTSGLTIKNGSIFLGASSTDTSSALVGSIALSNQDFTRTINNTPREYLRMAIGSKFGVKNDGTLYAAGADIDGHITARSLTINGTDYINQIPEIQNKASNSAEYEVVIKVKSIDYTTPEATLIAIPTKLGASTTGSFVWYKNAIGTPHEGTVSTTTNADDTLTVTDLDALYIAVLQ